MNLIQRISTFFSFFKKKKELKIQKFDSLENNIVINPSLMDELGKYSYEFIFTEFGRERVNCGGALLSNENRLEPTLSGIKKFFPTAKITVFTDFDWEDSEGLNIQKVDSPIAEPEHPRFRYRTGDFFKFKGLTESDADFACAIDTDMFFVNQNIFSLVTLTKKFGFCVPYSPRQIINLDIQISLDSKPVTDDSLGNGHSYNQSPITLWKGDERGKAYYKSCMEIMKNTPSRGSIVMWKAAWETGIYPYILPKQFCVCGEDIGCNHEILLHVGHPTVAKHYNIKI